MEQNNFISQTANKRHNHIALIVILAFFILTANQVKAQEAAPINDNPISAQAKIPQIKAPQANKIQVSSPNKNIEAKGLVYDNFARLIFYTNEDRKSVV